MVQAIKKLFKSKETKLSELKYKLISQDSIVEVAETSYVIYLSDGQPISGKLTSIPIVSRDRQSLVDGHCAYYYVPNIGKSALQIHREVNAVPTEIWHSNFTPIHFFTDSFIEIQKDKKVVSINPRYITSIVYDEPVIKEVSVINKILVPINLIEDKNV